MSEEDRDEREKRKSQQMCLLAARWHYPEKLRLVGLNTRGTRKVTMCFNTDSVYFPE